MRINGYRCDGCGKEHLLEAYYEPKSHGERLPRGWFMLYRGEIAPDEEPWLFCSKKCLRHHPLSSFENECTASGDALLDRYKSPMLTIECEYDGRKYKGDIPAKEEST